MGSTKTFINASMSAMLGLMLLAVAAGSVAAEGAHIDSCKAEVRRHYGMDKEVMVVSERRAPSGTQVRMAARLDQHRTEFVNCWVPSSDKGDGSYGRGRNTFAARLERAATILPY